ncbi:hypothetical protein [Methanobrevibacter millerae]|uniref:Uncharacterized protein n=1 Tax=Methanobrevibacter millerae TaxID=230361 RepID=A0A1G5VHI9_9EURY|nr:hypothetical protein [Methanobrevibacter millerae]SDA45168.1 hypothetical protein SAMN02910315_00603 [Methanobrevibacter millerae]
MLDLLNKSVIDWEKRELIESIIHPVREKRTMLGEYCDERYDLAKLSAPILLKRLEKICPECHSKFPKQENFCHKCSVRLVDINAINIEDIEIPHEINSENVELSEIFTKENIDKLSEFNFNKEDLDQITDNIKASSIETLDKALKDNHIYFDDLYVRDKILIYAKAFTNINFKSYGQELGNYLLGDITIDDRQSDILQITTLLHELAHFLLADILAEILSKTLEMAKSNQIKAIIHYILSSNDFFRLLDEYCAHSAESRFTLYGFQDYSSFKNILNTTKLNEDCIDAAKLFGNTYSKLIIQILESVIDRNLRNEIKNEFINDYMTPSFEDLRLETCRVLIDEDLIYSINYILNTGFEGAINNQDKIEEYSKRF